MTSPADQISDIIPNTIIEGTTGWSRFVGKLPSDPNQAVCFYDTGGMNPQPKLLLDYRSIQVVVRAEPSEYGDAYSKLQDIKDVLLGIDPQTLTSGDRVSGIIGIGDILLLHYDEKSRPVLAMNFRVFWEPATNSLTNRESL